MSRYDFEEPLFSFDPEMNFYKRVLEFVNRVIDETKNLRSHVATHWHLDNYRLMPQLAYERILALNNYLDKLKKDNEKLYQKYKDDFDKAYQKVSAEIDYFESNQGSKIDTGHRYFDDIESFTKAPEVNSKPNVKGGKGAEMVRDKKKINEAYLDDIYEEAKKYIKDNPNNYLTKGGNPTSDFYGTVHRRLNDHAQVDGETIKKPSKSTVKNRLIDRFSEKS